VLAGDDSLAFVLLDFLNENQDKASADTIARVLQILWVLARSQ
jgi:hypothetical protein